MMVDFAFVGLWDGPTTQFTTNLEPIGLPDPSPLAHPSRWQASNGQPTPELEAMRQKVKERTFEYVLAQAAKDCSNGRHHRAIDNPNPQAGKPNKPSWGRGKTRKRVHDAMGQYLSETDDDGVPWRLVEILKIALGAEEITGLQLEHEKVLRLFSGGYRVVDLAAYCHQGAALFECKSGTVVPSDVIHQVGFNLSIHHGFAVGVLIYIDQDVRDDELAMIESKGILCWAIEDFRTWLNQRRAPSNGRRRHI